MGENKRRRRSKKLTLSDDSINALIQEVYNDCLTQKEQISDQVLSREQEMKDNKDLDLNYKSNLIKANNDGLKLINNIIDKKLDVLKEMLKYVKISDTNESNVSISDEDRKMIEAHLKKLK